MNFLHIYKHDEERTGWILIMDLIPGGALSGVIDDLRKVRSASLQLELLMHW